MNGAIIIPCPEEIGARASIRMSVLSVRAIALNYLEWHVPSKIYVSEIHSFLLLKHVKCLIFRTKQGKAEL